MSSSQKSLKQENEPKINIFVFINILFFLILINAFSVDNQLSLTIGDLIVSIPDKVYSSIIWSTAIGLISRILCGQLGNEFKYFLIFLRQKYQLPACRAFSQHMNKDPRIDPKKIKNYLPNLPTEPDEQNRVWYTLYKVHEDKPSVLNAHRNFLLMREIASLSFIFLITFGPSSFVFASSLKLCISYMIGLSIIFFLVSQAARNYSIQFVTNVLAEESAK